MNIDLASVRIFEHERIGRVPFGNREVVLRESDDEPGRFVAVDDQVEVIMPAGLLTQNRVVSPPPSTQTVSPAPSSQPKTSTTSQAPKSRCLLLIR